jgi:hypothetical protein
MYFKKILVDEIDYLLQCFSRKTMVALVFLVTKAAAYSISM